MCEFLKISRSKFYYKKKFKIIDTGLENKVIKIFKDSYENYGSRKIKNDLDKITKLTLRHFYRRLKFFIRTGVLNLRILKLMNSCMLLKLNVR